jgi:hypothetical protein
VIYDLIENIGAECSAVVFFETKLQIIRHKDISVLFKDDVIKALSQDATDGN